MLGDRLSAESSNQKIAWTPSRLGDEPFRRADGTGAKIAMPAAGKTHEVLGRLDLGIQPLAGCNRNDSVLVAMHHQHRRRNLVSASKSERNLSFMKSRTGTNQ